MELEEIIAGQIAMSENPGDTIRKWREEFKVSPSELARQLKVTPSVVSDYESGRRKSPGTFAVRKIVLALIEIDRKRGSPVSRKFNSGVPPSALIDIKDYDHDIKLERVIKAINGINVSSPSIDRYIRGYTIVNGVQVALTFSYSEYGKLYGWSSQRVIFFTEVTLGRSPMIAIRAHPLKPAAVVYIKPGKIDPLALKISELENIPLIVTESGADEIVGAMSSLR
ncbi:MAG: helix-turn-helix domain-containing protein [Candidatus Thermoplasmatota archaeon]|jgi:putative transcriptional regulator|nr:helix-turn-helix domain-containing protein [Candidatus Thermoplasmatota archaeon]MCL5793932.1 helix-turn-helix domain-containing protein [Candidatus Thermoplasmatota archaeon]